MISIYAGRLRQFTGDSIYTIFGAPDSKREREDALACVRMALEMEVEMKALREKWWNQGVQFPFEKGFHYPIQTYRVVQDIDHLNLNKS